MEIVPFIITHWLIIYSILVSTYLNYTWPVTILSFLSLCSPLFSLPWRSLGGMRACAVRCSTTSNSTRGLVALHPVLAGANRLERLERPGEDEDRLSLACAGFAHLCNNAIIIPSVQWTLNSWRILNTCTHVENWMKKLSLNCAYAHTHTHTHTHISVIDCVIVQSSLLILQ